MSVAFSLLTYDAAPWEDLMHRWASLEALGYDNLYAGDHLWSLGPPQQSPGKPRYECWLLAGGIASATHRVGVGPLVSAMTLRQPALVAKQAITLDHWAAGRLRLGIGAGGNPMDEAIAGVHAMSGSERARRFEEYVGLLDALLSRDAHDHDEGAYASQGWKRVPPPVQHPRPHLMVAAHVPDTLRVAARHADTWSSYGALFSETRRGIKPSPIVGLERTRERAEMLEGFAVEYGRRPDEIAKSFLVGFTGDEPWQSIDAFEDFVGRYAEIGITEFVFPYPLVGRVGPEVFERVTSQILPKWRR